MGLPVYGHLPGEGVAHLLDHVAQGVAQAMYGRLITMEGAYVDVARNKIVMEALEDAEADGITHLFFHDQDVIVPNGVLLNLHKHDLPVVGGIYFGRDPAYTPVAFDLDPFERLSGFEDEDGLNKIGGIGMGATLIELDVFRRMREELPDLTDSQGRTWWFRCQDVEGQEPRSGEDVWFAMNCARLGIPIYVDASVRCKHLGTFSVGWDNWKKQQEA